MAMGVVSKMSFSCHFLLPRVLASSMAQSACVRSTSAAGKLVMSMTLAASGRGGRRQTAVAVVPGHRPTSPSASSCLSDHLLIPPQIVTDPSSGPPGSFSPLWRLSNRNSPCGWGRGRPCAWLSPLRRLSKRHLSVGEGSPVPGCRPPAVLDGMMPGWALAARP